MKTKANMPKRTQHCDTEIGKHCDTFSELGFNPNKKPTLMLLARYLGTNLSQLSKQLGDSKIVIKST